MFLVIVIPLFLVFDFIVMPNINKDNNKENNIETTENVDNSNQNNTDNKESEQNVDIQICLPFQNYRSLPKRRKACSDLGAPSICCPFFNLFRSTNQENVCSKF